MRFNISSFDWNWAFRNLHEIRFWIDSLRRTNCLDVCIIYMNTQFTYVNTYWFLRIEHTQNNWKRDRETDHSIQCKIKTMIIPIHKCGRFNTTTHGWISIVTMPDPCRFACADNRNSKQTQSKHHSICRFDFKINDCWHNCILIPICASTTIKYIDRSALFETGVSVKIVTYCTTWTSMTLFAGEAWPQFAMTFFSTKLLLLKMTIIFIAV